jgi:hypothetical protein
MSPRVIRAVVQVICVLGIAGMIAGSIADNNGIAITFGLVTAVAVLGLILVTTTAGAGAFAKRRSGPGGGPPLDDETATDLEGRVRALVAAGADEDEVRLLVRRALDAGRRH